MKNLAQVWGRAPRVQPTAVDVNWVDPKQLIGIEIEAEHQNASLPESYQISNWWEITSDGSLRNGNEYRLNRPMAGNDLANAIRNFFSSGRIRRAITSGTHIHVDMMEEHTSIGSMQALYLLVYILEPAIFSIVDAGREWCGYTNSLESAPADLHAVMLDPQLDNVSEKLVSLTNQGRRFKYYGLNFVPLSRFGSVEFRYFPTATSEAEMVEWVQLVMSFKQAAYRLGSTAALSEVTANVSAYDNFIRVNFEPWADRILSVMPATEAAKRCRTAMLKHVVASSAKWPKFDGKCTESKRFSKFFAKAAKAWAEMQERMSATGGSYTIISCPHLSYNRAINTLREMNSAMLGNRDALFRTGLVVLCADGVMLFVEGEWLNAEGIDSNWNYQPSRIRSSVRFRNMLNDLPVLQQDLLERIEFAQVSLARKDGLRRAIIRSISNLTALHENQEQLPPFDLNALELDRVTYDAHLHAQQVLWNQRSHINSMRNSANAHRAIVGLSELGPDSSLELAWQPETAVHAPAADPMGEIAERARGVAEYMAAYRPVAATQPMPSSPAEMQQTITARAIRDTSASWTDLAQRLHEVAEADTRMRTGRGTRRSGPTNNTTSSNEEQN